MPATATKKGTPIADVAVEVPHFEDCPQERAEVYEISSPKGVSQVVRCIE